MKQVILAYDAPDALVIGYSLTLNACLEIPCVAAVMANPAADTDNNENLWRVSQSQVDDGAAITFKSAPFNCDSLPLLCPTPPPPRC